MVLCFGRFGRNQKCEKTLSSYGFDGELYYLADTNAAFSPRNEQHWNNLTNYLFPEGEKVNDAFGIPLNYIVDKKGRLLKSHIEYQSETRVNTRSLYYVKETDIRLPDFSQTDTLVLDYKPFVCTSKGCY